MNTNVLFIFSLSMALGWTFIFSAARFQYSGVEAYKEEAASYHKRFKQQQLRTALAEMQVKEFQQQVATLLPSKIPTNDESSYPLRQLASAVTKVDPYKLKLSEAKVLLEKGKRAFRDKQYGAANRAFKTIIDHYSYSSDIVEAHFLYAEGLFQQRNFELCTQVIHKMIEQFPSSELTGYSMVRLGRIFEAQNRSSEALEIYRTVVQSFPQRDLASQAVESIKLLEL